MAPAPSNCAGIENDLAIESLFSPPHGSFLRLLLYQLLPCSTEWSGTANVFKMSYTNISARILNDGRVIYSRWEYVDRAAAHPSL